MGPGAQPGHRSHPIFGAETGAGSQQPGHWQHGVTPGRTAQHLQHLLKLPFVLRKRQPQGSSVGCVSKAKGSRTNAARSPKSPWAVAGGLRWAQMWSEQESRGPQAASTGPLLVRSLAVAQLLGNLPELRGDGHGSEVWGHGGQVWLASCKTELPSCPSLCPRQGK